MTTTTLAVHLRYFAGAAEAAGTGEECVELPAGSTGRELIAALSQQRPPLRRVLAISSLLVDDVVREDLDQSLATSTATVRVDVLPPFAGG